MARFIDRRQAGQALGERLAPLAGSADLTVLALPRGGVPVGYEVARRLGAPLDVFVVRKLGMPGHEEYAIGAIASGGVQIDNEALTRQLRISPDVVERVAARERIELTRREQAYRSGRAPLDVRGRIVVLVDDGLATGSTMRAAVLGLRQLGPARIIVAVPVAAPDACEDLRDLADEVVCAITPEPFRAVGLWYEDFDQTSDAEVQRLLAAASRHEEVHDARGQ